jgi:excisionase family DNA binding protein
MERVEDTVRRTYRVEEIATMLGVSRAAAYNLVGAGYIRAIRAGRLILVPVDALEEFLQRTSR